MKRYNTNLIWFILLSLGLHALIISTWRWDNQMTMAPSATPLILGLNRVADDTSTKPLSTQQNTSVAGNTVAKDKPRQTAKSTAQQSASKRIKSDIHNKKVSREITRAEKRHTKTKLPEDDTAKQNTIAEATLAKLHAVETPQTTTDNATRGPTTSATQANEQQAINTRIQEQLSVRIAFNQHYPRIAVRNAWEGQVNLSIRVLASGELTNIHVIDSSGYNLLDKAAVNSVLRVASLPQARAWLQGRDIDVILPIIYKLTDS